MSVREFAPAKINLTLTVGRPRADGMHPLQSAVVFADVGDWIEAAPSDVLSLRIVGPFKDQLSEGDAENLVLRAARALAREAGIEPCATLALEKNLPVASGIGGGSADAAATLRALNRLWSLNLDAARLDNIARALGSDVPVCVASRPAFMTGTGADWAPVQAPSFDAVLVNPHREISTTLVYREFDRMHLGAAFTPGPTPTWCSRAEAITAIAATGNDLATAAMSLVADIELVIEILRNDARVQCAALSGSGATCFALVDDAEAAHALAADFRAAHPRWWIAPTILAGT